MLLFDIHGSYSLRGFSSQQTRFDYWEGERITVWSEPVLLVEVIFLAWESVVYLVLAICLDMWSGNPRALSIWKNFADTITLRRFVRRSQPSALTVREALPDDEDVVLEQERVINGEATNDLIVLNRLSKVYDNGTVAVDNFSLGVPPGECFGLLGINGAGKTTTLQMLTAELPPSSGDATLAGFSVRNHPEKTRRRIGYCPQVSASNNRNKLVSSFV